MSESVDDAALANCEACPQYMHCKTTLRYKCLARTLMENKPRKVRLPEPVTLGSDYGIERPEGAKWTMLMRHEVIAAMRAAGVEVEV